MKTYFTRTTTITRLLSLRSNVFLITNGKVNVLVDTGTGRARNRLLRNLRRLQVDHIDFLILTHTHFDHAGNAARIKQEFGAKVIVHTDEADFLENGEIIIPDGTNFFSDALIKTFSRVFDSVARYETCKADIRVETGLDLDSYGINVSLLHTPGHTKGSVSVIIDDQIGLVGDTMFGIFPGSVFPPFANDVPALIESWGLLLKTGCKIFLPSHGTEDSRELLERDFESRKPGNGDRPYH